MALDCMLYTYHNLIIVWGLSNTYIPSIHSFISLSVSLCLSLSNFIFYMIKLQSGSTHSSLVMLDSSTVNFRSSLAALDRMPTRYCDSVFVLYCRKGQNKIEEILANQVYHKDVLCHQKCLMCLHYLSIVVADFLLFALINKQFLFPLSKTYKPNLRNFWSFFKD